MPVDYAQPDGEQVGIAVSRLRATQPDQANRIPGVQLRRSRRRGQRDAGRLRRADPGRDPGPVRPRELRSTWHRQVAAGRVRRRRHRRPAQRGRSHAQLRRRSPPVLRRHQRARRRRRALRRAQRRLAGAARQPQRRPRSRSAPRRTRRRHAVVHRVLLRDRDRRGLRADVPRPRRAHGARLARRSLGRRARGAATGIRRASSRRSTTSSPTAPPTARCPFRSSGDPAAALATLEQRFESGLELPTYDLATGATSKRKAGVAAFYTALHLRALRQGSSAGPNLAERAARRPRGDGTYLLSCWPTSTTAGATTAATTTSTRSSA